MSTVPREPPATPWSLPNPLTCDPDDDVCAVGADLEPGTLLAAYRIGLFPMRLGDSDDDPLGWWSPVERAVLPLDGLVVRRSLRKVLNRFEITLDACFAEVMHWCAAVERDRGWITPAFERAFGELHRRGWAHSVEVWQQGRLVGGLYGVEIGGLFAGESMFHLVPDASKVALVGLVHGLGGAEGARAGRVLDIQWATEHLLTMGAQVVGRRRYVSELLPAALLLPPALAGAPGRRTT